MNDWQRSAVTGLFLMLGLGVAYIIGHATSLDTAIGVAFFAGVITCYVIVAIRMRH